MVKCECGKQYEKQSSLNSHARFCDKYVKTIKHVSKYKINENLYICECLKEFNNHQALNGHFCFCLIHRNGELPAVSKIGIKGQMTGWNNFTDDDISKIKIKSGETSKVKIKSGEIIPHFRGKKHTIESKEKMSLSRQNVLENNESHCKWYSIFNGEKEIKVQGTWERDIAIYLTECNIKWERKQIVYLEYKRYTPDFYLPEYNIYLEIKGWWREYDILKTKNVLKEHNINLLLIDSLKILKDFINNKITLKDLIHFNDKFKI